VGREQQRVWVMPHMGGQVCLDHRHQVRRDGHVAGTGVTLGSTRRVTEVAAEIRMNEANIQKWTATLDPGMDTAKSMRHVAAANARWHRHGSTG